MASEVFVSAMLLITAVVASAILIAAVFPVVWTMVSTFSSASHDTDTRMRTDFKIVTTFACGSGGSICTPTQIQISKVWMKNIGSSRIGIAEINQSDVFVGPVGNFGHVDKIIGYPLSNSNPAHIGKWDYVFSDNNNNGFWDSGETLEVDAISSQTITSGGPVYFQFVLPNGVYRSSEFTSL